MSIGAAVPLIVILIGSQHNWSRELLRKETNPKKGNESADQLPMFDFCSMTPSHVYGTVLISHS